MPKPCPEWAAQAAIRTQLGVLLLALMISLPVHSNPIQLLLESDDDRLGGSEVFMVTFQSFADLLNANFSGAFSDLDIGANFSAGGLAYDGSNYQLLLESDDDRLGGSEVFMVTFESFADLLTANFSGAFSDLDIGVSFSAGGLAYQLEMPPDPAPIPVPGTLALLAASFLGYRFVSGARRPPGN